MSHVLYAIGSLSDFLFNDKQLKKTMSMDALVQLKPHKLINNNRQERPGVEKLPGSDGLYLTQWLNKQTNKQNLFQLKHNFK